VSNYVIVPNFVKISRTAAKIWRFFDFSKMANVRHLGFVMRVLKTPTKGICGLYHCANLVDLEL